MSTLPKAGILFVLLSSTLACGLIRHPAPPTVAISPSGTTRPADTPAFTDTVAPTATSAATQTAASPADTATADSGSLPSFFGSLSNISQYFNPVGQPVASWNGIPIMQEASAGQEFVPGQVYSFKAAVTIAQAVDFYQSKLPALGFTPFMAGPGTGSAGTGTNAIHNSTLFMTKGTTMVLIYIASYDSDPSHVAVVISTQ